MERSLRKINEAKRKARSELKEEDDWSRMGYMENFNVTADEVRCRDSVPRINSLIVSKEEFIKEYENPCKPVVLTHAMDQWPAMKTWTAEKLVRKYRNQSFKCGEDDSGRSVRLKLKYFCKYIQCVADDDSPLYIFDSNYGEHHKRKRLLNDYFIPEYFKDDLFQYASDYRRPPHRWFVMGARRSGTNIHIDPLGTSAWNSLIRGHKWWCLFPPECEKGRLKVPSGEGWKNRQESISWFNIVYPITQSPHWPQHLKPLEILQSGGETVFVPWGWWHVVLNLDDTIAVTQNFCSRANLQDVWLKTVKSRPRLAENWLHRLQICRPEIANIIREIPIQTRDTTSDSSSSSSSSSSDSSDSDSDSSTSEDDGKSAGKRLIESDETNGHKSMKSAPGSRRSPSRKRMR